MITTRPVKSMLGSTLARKLALQLLAILLYPATSIAIAPTLQERCYNDPGYPDQGRRRVAWARKCNYISEKQAVGFDMLEMYPTFVIEGHSMYLFFDENAACFDRSLVHLVGACSAVGCFAESTRLAFEFSDESLPQAFENQTHQILALKPRQNFVEELEWIPEPIDKYMKGYTTEDLLEISAGERVIAVTSNHPMVLASGEIVSASELQVGALLAMVNGAHPVMGLRSLAYKGFVWNVQVSSRRRGANIHLAEGFLTGGLRFQNEWTDVLTRRLKRIDIDQEKDR